MDNLKKGDVLIRLSDNSEWEFSEYARGLVTTRADNQEFKGRSGIIKSTVMVRPLDQTGNKLSSKSFRGMQASEFKKADLE
ncbi:hypothetical protein ACFSUS_22610 [Spirosoma soli]|uniref:Uncharacterized protein n=1 Tax=Spirosoma soli TaxID=1770529 RepID=A0ABW5M906_9BACT